MVIIKNLPQQKQPTFSFDDDIHGSPGVMAVGEQPQQRMVKFGSAAVSDTELLAMVLQGNGTSPIQAVATASRVVAEAGSISRLLSWTPSDYQRIKGIGHVKALQLSAIGEISRRMMSVTNDKVPALGRPELVAEYFAPLTVGLEVEKFWVLCLNRKNRLLKRVEVTSGTATNSLVHPREVFRDAIRESAAAIVCVHNHPSGDPSPSSADIQVTRQLREASKTVGIDLTDHVIMGTKAHDPSGLGYYSFRNSGVL